LSRHKRFVLAVALAAWSLVGDRDLARADAPAPQRELRWGVDSQGGAPYAFQNPMDPNHLIGFEAELADAVAARLGLRARPVPGQWESLLDLLARGDFDVALNGIEVTDEKKRVCQLSHAYYVAPEQLTVRRGDASAPRSLDALRGRRIGTLPGSLAERILRRAGADVRTYTSGQDAIYADLKLARTDAVLLDEPATLYYGAIEPELEVVDGDFGEVRYAVAVPLGNDALRAAVDDAIDALARDGTLRRIYERWGIWNERTAALFGDSRPRSTLTVATSLEAWRAAVGRQPPFWTRVVKRYPQLMPLFARGAAITLVLSLLAMSCAVAAGVFLAIGRSFAPRPIRWLCLAVIEVIRGTPLFVQLIIVYFGLPEIGLKLPPFVAGWLALSINYAAAEAENYRAGFESVPAGQQEAAWSLGLTRWQAIVYVVAPQALRVALPPMTNDFIALLKDSSLVALVTITELTKTYLNLASATRDHLGLGAVVAAWYLVIGLPFAQLARFVERRLARRLRRFES
jgi:polar amino acid transport system permease protein/polar amino acid transport system substrate-binding protein